MDTDYEREKDEVEAEKKRSYFPIIQTEDVLLCIQ